MKRLLNALLVLLILAAPILPIIKVGAAPGPNLINNPSVETVNATNSSLPQNWQQGKWGTNTATFTYPTTGQDGSRSVRVDMSSYTSGDAKWYFNPVTVQASKSYTFSTFYQSSVTSDIVVQLQDAGGNSTYQWLTTAAASPSAWQSVSANFTTAANTTSVTVFHVIAANGFLQTDNAYFGLTDVAPTPDAPTVSVTAPVANATLSGTHSVKATAASPGAAVAGVQFKIDGANLGAEDTTAPYEIDWDTTTATNAAHNVTAVARSTNGLSTTSSAVPVTVSNTVTPPPTGNNLVANPSMETANGQAPASWLTNAWGTNTPSFTYEANGQEGAKSAKTTVSAHTDGDAKWYFAPVNITANKEYKYTHYYKSGVGTELVVAYIDANNNYTYQWIKTVPASATNWQQTEATFTTPASAKKVTVFHVVGSVGSLQIDNASLTETTTTPPTNNPIPNASVENGTNNPNNWEKSNWGSNTPTYQYITNDGHNGNKSVKVTVSNHQSGDAKWMFSPITTLTPGSQYRFSTWYKANIVPEAVAMYVMADGSEQYFGMPDPEPGANANTTWQHYSDTFTVPVGATAVSVFLFADKNGWIQTDDYNITNYQPAGFTRPLLSLTFDDGHEENATTALPLLNTYGFKTTHCFATTFIEGQPQAIQNVLAFKNSGHEICAHSVTHPMLTTVSPSTLQFELEHSQDYLESITGAPVPNFATPYGDYNVAVNNAIKQYYQSHRTVDEGYNSKDNFNIHRIRVQNMQYTTTMAEFQSWINQAKATNTWLVLVYHRIADNPNQFDTYIDDFQDQLQAIQASGITVKTYQGALDEVRSQL